MRSALLSFFILPFFFSCTSVQEKIAIEDEIEIRIHRESSRCLSQDYRKLPCDDLAATLDYSPVPNSEFKKNIVDTFTKEAKSYYVPHPFGVSKARKELFKAIRKIRKKIANDKLGDCHSACLIQCFTANVISYDDKMAEDVTTEVFHPADLGPYDTLAYGKGVCRNYAHLYKEIGRLLGTFDKVTDVRTWSSATKNNLLGGDGNFHRVIGYKENGILYLIEPQRDPIETKSCERYKHNP